MEEAKKGYQEFANILKEAVSENNRQISFQEKCVQQVQRRWDIDILKANRRREVSSALDELPHLEDKGHRGIKEDQGHVTATTALLQDTGPQDFLQCVY